MGTLLPRVLGTLRRSSAQWLSTEAWKITMWCSELLPSILSSHGPLRLESRVTASTITTIPVPLSRLLMQPEAATEKGKKPHTYRTWVSPKAKNPWLRAPPEPLTLSLSEKEQQGKSEPHGLHSWHDLVPSGTNPVACPEMHMRRAAVGKTGERQWPGPALLSQPSVASHSGIAPEAWEAGNCFPLYRHGCGNLVQGHN